MNSVDEITRMIYRYCTLFDAGDFDAFAQQFEHGSMGGREAGSASLRQWIDDHIILYDGSPCTRHLTTNLVVDVDEETGTAAARSYVTVLQAPPGRPMAIIGSAEYHDRFERVDGVWRWAERKVVNILGGDSSHHVRASA
jgi:3-phenylpropionate/cinnamic acid dioxygenase small subunit